MAFSLLELVVADLKAIIRQPLSMKKVAKLLVPVSTTFDFLGLCLQHLVLLRTFLAHPSLLKRDLIHLS